MERNHAEGGEAPGYGHGHGHHPPVGAPPAGSEAAAEDAREGEVAEGLAAMHQMGPGPGAGLPPMFGVGTQGMLMPGMLPPGMLGLPMVGPGLGALGSAPMAMPGAAPGVGGMGGMGGGAAPPLNPSMLPSNFHVDVNMLIALQAGMGKGEGDHYKPFTRDVYNEMPFPELRAHFARKFGQAPRSNNRVWIINKLTGTTPAKMRRQMEQSGMPGYGGGQGMDDWDDGDEGDGDEGTSGAASVPRDPAPHSAPAPLPMLAGMGSAPAPAPPGGALGVMSLLADPSSLSQDQLRLQLEVLLQQGVISQDQLQQSGVLRRRKRNNMWTPEETAALVDGVARHGVSKWAEIKRENHPELRHRTAVDLKDRWRNLVRMVRTGRHRGERDRALTPELLTQVRQVLAAEGAAKGDVIGMGMAVGMGMGMGMGISQGRLPDNFSAGLLLGNAVPFPIAPPGVPGITPSPFHLPMGPHSMPLSMPMAMPLAMHADPAGGNAANPSGPGSEAASLAPGSVPQLPLGALSMPMPMPVPSLPLPPLAVGVTPMAPPFPAMAQVPSALPASTTAASAPAAPASGVGVDGAWQGVGMQLPVGMGQSGESEPPAGRAEGGNGEEGAEGEVKNEG